MEKISKQHEKFKYMRDSLKKCPSGYTITDDIDIINLALNNNLEIALTLYAYDNEYSEMALNIINELTNKSKEIYEISSSSYDILKLKNNHAGIISMIKIKDYTFDDFKNKDFLVILDHLEIPGNVGTIYRTLDSINIDGVIIVDEITKLNNINVTSSSRGTNLLIPTISSSYENTIKYLLDNNYDIYLGEPILGKPYNDYDYNGKVAIVVGNERFGINSDWYNHKSKKVFIPMEGTQNSLNVSIALSIIAYEAYMKRK